MTGKKAIKKHAKCPATSTLTVKVNFQSFIFLISLQCFRYQEILIMIIKRKMYTIIHKMQIKVLYKSEHKPLRKKKGGGGYNDNTGI